MFMRNALTEITKTLSETILIVALVVFLFMGSVRTALVPLVAMPVSLIGAALFMFAFGFSLNLLTLQIGHGLAATSPVLAAFMGGLAAGCAAGGRLTASMDPRRALRLYGMLELAIGVLALVLPFELAALGQRLLVGRSSKGASRSTRTSPGRPSTRSAMMLRWISSVPAAMREPGEDRSDSWNAARIGAQS